MHITHALTLRIRLEKFLLNAEERRIFTICVFDGFDLQKIIFRLLFTDFVCCLYRLQ